MGKERATIIYVDDVNICLMPVKDSLKNYYDVYTAHSVEKMFELLEEHQKHRSTNPDLILLDYYMPETDGFGTITELKNDTRYAGIPVVFLSSNHDENTINMAMQLGAADYITKPFTDSKLIERLEALL